MNTIFGLVLMVGYLWVAAITARNVYLRFRRNGDDPSLALMPALGAFVFWPLVGLGLVAVYWMEGPIRKEAKEREKLEGEITFWDKAGFDTSRSAEERAMAKSIASELREKRNR